MSLSLVFATTDWSAFWLMVVLLWGTMGMLAFLQANAQVGGDWVDWWLCRLAETRFIIGGQLDFCLYLILGLLAVAWVILMGPIALQSVWCNREDSIFEIPLGVAGFFASFFIEERPGDLT